jgi:uncharacterized protein (DUF924 family)
MQAEAQEILDFWLDEVGVAGWYAVDPAVDVRIGDRWRTLWEKGRRGELSGWMGSPRSCLALLILLDQFPRNMFRGDALAFATDALAVQTAKLAILHGRDQRVDLPERQFFYLPLMHSEILDDQNRSVRLILINFGRDSATLRHALAHRHVIRRFGRFPYRNAALGRESTEAEVAFLEAGGYQAAFAAVESGPALAAPRESG